MANTGSSSRQLLAQALDLYKAGRLAEAESAYRRAIQRDPKNAQALHLLGVLLAQTNRPQDGLEHLDRAISLSPRVGAFHTNRGNTLRQLGNFVAAVESYRRAAELDPKDAEFQINLANGLRDAGQRDDAIAAYRKGIELRPNFAAAHCFLGNALREMGRMNEAIDAHQRAVELEPKSAGFLSNYAISIAEVGRQVEAIELLQRAIQLDPRLVQAHANLSDAYRAIGRLAESVAAAARAVELKPDLPEPRINLGNALMQQGRVEFAIKQYSTAAQLNPASPDAVSNGLYSIHNRVVNPQWLFAEHCRWADVFAAPRAARIQPHRNNRDADRRLRIGYVSADFRQHAVGRLILPVIEAHDATQFEVTCYSQATKSDDLTTRTRATAHHWQEIAGLTDAALADLIRHDQIDILIDLAGHTAGDRLLAFAEKPAPIQITWIGYPDTTGLKTIDYRIVDAITDPPGDSDLLHTEKLIRLDPCFLCLRPPEEAIEDVARSDQFTFGSFNNFAKVSTQAMQLWARVLNEVPNARLLLKSRGLGYPGTVDIVREALSAHGVPLDHVEIRSHVDLSHHLRTYNEIDAALDTFPYTGTATTCDALSMGVPVITLAGSTHVSRVTTSILNAAGIQDCTARTPEEYVAKARLAAAAAGRRTRKQREQLRSQLKASPLCDEKSFTRKLESAYREMWQVWCAQPPSA